MSSYVRLHHHTRYRYDRPVMLGPQTIRLRPVTAALSAVSAYALRVAPPYSAQTWHHDGYGNMVAQVVFDQQVTFFDITVELQADLTPRNPLNFVVQDEAQHWMHRPTQELQFIQPFYGLAEREQELKPYFAPVQTGPLVQNFLQGWTAQAPTETVAMLMALNRALASRIRYQVRLVPGVWGAEETLERETGSCRDSAWLLVALLRELGFAARFVSGYLIQSCMNGEGVEVLTCDLHAWAEAYLPGAGWIGFDTTSGLLTAQAHVGLAATVMPEEAAPVSGLLDACHAEMDVTMQAQRLFA